MSNAISISHARRLLGELAKDFDDTQVLDLIVTLDLLSKEQMQYNGSKGEEKDVSVTDQ